MQERILCAATWYDDNESHVHQPTSTGIVFCTHRHHVVFPMLYDLLGEELHAKNRFENRYTQGFLTSANRFVGREEALEIAANAQQITMGDTSHETQLFSEDLY